MTEQSKPLPQDQLAKAPQTDNPQTGAARLPPATLIAEYDGIAPRFGGPLAHGGEGSAVLGRAVLGQGAWLGAFSVIRGDGHDIVLGNSVYLGRHATVHIAHDTIATHIGHRVTASDGGVIHACTVGDDCVIGRDAVILDGSRIGAGAVLDPGAVVFPRSALDGGWRYAGAPARPVEPVTPAALAAAHAAIRQRPAAPQPFTPGPRPKGIFTAPSAALAGEITAAEGVGIWYGCALDAGAHRIAIGAGSNIQDNSTLRCEAAGLLIGKDVTIGHNVTLTDCTIHSGSLIGIGARIAAGTVVESDVLVAAGATTEPGQVLTGGQLWAGSPARPRGPLDEGKRRMMAGTVALYRHYAGVFARTPHERILQG